MGENMYCPRCPGGIELVRFDYEGFFTQSCPQCRGFLLSPLNLRGIERKQETTLDILHEESKEIADSPADAYCPKCKKKMNRKRAPQALPFKIDICSQCKLIWLDHGELEAIQIAYEQSPAGQEALELRKRMENMSDERREEMERNIAKAKDYFECDDDDDPFGMTPYSHERLIGKILGNLISSFFKF
jgi:Zn-finger nucleic acid-binding protein